MVNNNSLKSKTILTKQCRYSVLSLNPRNAERRLIADELCLLSLSFLHSFHTTSLLPLFIRWVPIAVRCWE